MDHDPFETHGGNGADESVNGSIGVISVRVPVTDPCQDVRFSSLFIAFGRPLASYAERSPGRSNIPIVLGTEPLETSDLGDDDEVGMERGEKSGEDADADAVELDFAC